MRVKIILSAVAAATCLLVGFQNFSAVVSPTITALDHLDLDKNVIVDFSTTNITDPFYLQMVATPKSGPAVVITSTKTVDPSTTSYKFMSAELLDGVSYTTKLNLLSGSGDGTLLASTALFNSQPDACFQQAHNKLINVNHIFQWSSVPSADGAENLSANFPGTDFVSSKASATVVNDQTFSKFGLMWGNRCHFVTDAKSGVAITPSTVNSDTCLNPSSGYGTDGLVPPNEQLSGYLKIGDNPEVWPVFSTYRAANECSLLQARSLLGESFDSIKAQMIKDNAGDLLKLNLVTQTFSSSDVSDVYIGQGASKYEISALVDVCLISPTPALTNGTGLFLDYEVDDHRSEDISLSFLQALQKLFTSHGQKLALSTDALVPLDPTTSIITKSNHGIDWYNAADVLATVDIWILPIGSGASPAGNSHPSKSAVTAPAKYFHRVMDALSQKNAAGVKLKPIPPAYRKKLVWSVQPAELPLEDAQALNTLFVRGKYLGIYVAPGFVPMGGACDRQVVNPDGLNIPINQAIACLSFGQCDGKFGITAK